MRGRRLFRKVSLFTRPTLAVTSPARPESAKTASSPRDAPCPKQVRSSTVDPRFTPYVSRLLGAKRERRTGEGASRRAGVGRVRRATLSTAC